MNRFPRHYTLVIHGVSPENPESVAADPAVAAEEFLALLSGLGHTDLRATLFPAAVDIQVPKAKTE